MKNNFGTVVLSAFILAFLSSLAAPAARSPALESPRDGDSVAYRPGAAFESIPSLDSILQKYIEAIGGKEAIEKIQTRKLSGELVLQR